MLSIFKKIKIDYFLVFLIFIALFLIYNNYTPGTFLSGWDTLHPEFNFPLYFQRAFSFWQEHQGLGAPASQAHIADIPRVFLLWLLNFIFPMNFIRYSYFFLSIILGPVGLYLLTKFILNLDSKEKDSLVIKSSAFLGALFYLLNIGTMQHFIVPFEMFATKFAVLGFIYLYVIKYLIDGKQKNLLIFSLITLFSTSMAHTGTLWYIYFLGLVLFIFTFYIFKHKKIENLLQRSINLVAFTLLINLFWLLPNIYYGLNHGSDVIASKINRLFTQEAFYFNKKYGNISDFLLFKNFLFDWSIFNNSKESQALLSSWIIHLSNPFIKLLAFLFSTLSIGGAVMAIKKRSLILMALLPITFISTIFLLSNTPIFSQIFDLVRASNKLVGELLRFPFTKFSIYLIFTSSIYFAFINQFIIERLIKFFNKFKDYSVISVYFYTLIILVLIYSTPSFKGNFISPIIRVNIPSHYFELFKWFDSKENGRVLTLPMHTLFGWNYYVWEIEGKTQVYQGAGFNWFGIKQPTLNREFDRWYPYNEQAYKEFSYALYSKNSSLFINLLSKYKINYVLLDENIKNLENSNNKNLLIAESKKILQNIPKLKLTKLTNNISVYELNKNINNSKKYITKGAQISPKYSANYFDQAYVDYQTYFTYEDQQDNPNNIIYPARDFLLRSERVNKDILQFKNNKYYLKLHSIDSENQKINAPRINEIENTFYASIYLKGNEQNSDKRLILEYLIPRKKGATTSKQSINLGALTEFSQLVINNMIYEIPKKIGLKEIYLGDVSLNLKDENLITLINIDKINKTQLNEPEYNPFLCDDANVNQLFGINILNNGFDLFGKNAKTCLDIPIFNILNSQEIIRPTLLVNFQYKMPFNTRTEFCFYDKSTNSCLNKSILYPSIHNLLDFQAVLPSQNSQIDNLSLRFLFDTKKISTKSSLIIKNLSLDSPVKTKLLKFYINLNNITENINESLNLEGFFPSEKINILAKQINNEKNDCANKKSYFLDKKILKENGFEVLEYHSVEGTLCEAFTFSELNENSSYILGIESQNMSGLPLKICLEEDTTKKCVLEEELSSFKNMDYDYFVIPQYNNTGGYHLILRNISIGNVESINRLKSIKIVAFPFSYLQNIKILNKENYNKTDVLVFNQAYEKNWSAYLSGKRLKDHVLVNNWANGWVVDNNTDVNDIKFVFWPQYLEYLGFISLIFSFACMIFWKKKS